MSYFIYNVEVKIKAIMKSLGTGEGIVGSDLVPIKCKKMNMRLPDLVKSNRLNLEYFKWHIYWPGNCQLSVVESDSP